MSTLDAPMGSPYMQDLWTRLDASALVHSSERSMLLAGCVFLAEYIPHIWFRDLLVSEEDKAAAKAWCKILLSRSPSVPPSWQTEGFMEWVRS